METKDKLPKRKKNRLKDYDYSGSGAYFITVCTKEGECIFWDKSQPEFVGEDSILPPENVRLSTCGEIVKEAIEFIPKQYTHIELLRYVVMPNHIHMVLFIPYTDGKTIASPTGISTVVGQMKRYVSKKIGEGIWQKSFHDHVIRDKSDYEEIEKYIYENPAKWQYDCFYKKSK
ncbi:MAG: hypothetical protein E7380_04690 [Clostridiales bacterium]|nr:hypothetical protein [Clostridiales bacterium]MBQ2769553.1 transposase [Clostridia bacterium]